MRVFASISVIVVGLFIAVTVLVAAPDAGTLRFRKVSIIDRPDMIGGEVETFLCPADWQVEGGIIWRENPTRPATFHLRVFNPRGLEQLESFPTLMFSYGSMLGPGTSFPIGSNYLGTEVRPPVRNAIQYIKEIIFPRYRAGVQAQLIGEQELHNGRKRLLPRRNNRRACRLSSPLAGSGSPTLMPVKLLKKTFTVSCKRCPFWPQAG